MALDRPFEHHCMVAQSDEECMALYDGCKHKERHRDYIPVPEFRDKFLNPFCTKFTDFEKSWMDYLITCTVRVIVANVSVFRPPTFLQCGAEYPFHGKTHSRRCGTGFVYKYDQIPEDCELCPCPECKTSENPKTTFWKFLVSTATHVVFDKSEAETAMFELFYESDDRKGVKHLYGIDVLNNSYCRYVTDSCGIVCVTHDTGLAQVLTGLLDKKDRLLDYFQNRESRPGITTEILVSHPHGMSKRVSIGMVQEEAHAPCAYDLIYCCLSKSETKELQIVYIIKSQDEESDLTLTNDFLFKDNFLHINNTYCPPCLEHFITGLSRNYEQNIDRNTKEYNKICTSLDNASVEYNKKSVFFNLSDGIIAVMSLEHEVQQLDEKHWERSYLLAPGIILMSPAGKIHRTTTEIRLRIRTKNEEYKGPPKVRWPRLYYNMTACPGSSGSFIGVFGDYTIEGKQFNLMLGNHFGVSGNRSHNVLFSIVHLKPDKKINPMDSKVPVRDTT